MKRHKMNRGKSAKLFKRTAGHTNSLNMPRRTPMRGGIRL
jgi:hypothetical protein